MTSTVRLTRRVAFASGHRYWLPALSAEENRERFGAWASPYNHGHNYMLEATVEGVVNAENGMVVNIKDVDDVLQRTIVQQFDQRSINDEIPWFESRPSSTEAILDYIARELQADGVLPAEVRLTHLRLEETPLLIGELDLTTQKTSLTRVYEFAASHRLDVPSYSEEQNKALFGKCNNPAGHGHNYVVEVTVTGDVDPETGMLADIGVIDDIVEKLVVDRYDHKNFNVDLPEFTGKVTTSEVIVQEIFHRLQHALPVKLSRVRLFETPRNSFEVVAA